MKPHGGHERRNPRAIELQGRRGANAVKLDQAQVVPPTGSSATGTGMLPPTVPRARSDLVYHHTVVGASAADIHTPVTES